MAVYTKKKMEQMRGLEAVALRLLELQRLRPDIAPRVGDLSAQGVQVVSFVKKSPSLQVK